MEPLAISVNGAAKALGVGRSSIYGLLKSGRLEAIKIGRRTLLTTASINRLAHGELGDQTRQ
ncbi:helix-turn-helix domain-containing protein [Sphingorhabdus sp.]|jgi:excisionase family DNA binding protein|uniref:helix-turn-helix domain-containing protein n=1 Tax=Sphingorhabdus sp. TaxID=1902408 RepID=UPI0037C6F754|nr:helix-turn-helix domain-containing protein [Sphingomonadales bacterium]